MSEIGIGIGFAAKIGASAPPSSHALSMNGTSDKILLPSMTFDKLVFDVLVDTSQSVLRYYAQNNTGTSIYFRIDASNNLQIGGATQTGYAANTRTTITLNTTVVPSTAALYLFVRGSDGAASFGKGTLYDLKVYNGATLVAHYDMSTQTVNDQSGNGNNATLTGGTWISV